MKVGVVLVAALILTGTAAAAPTGKTMASTVKALHYPKPGAKTVACRNSGAGYKCKAVYRHHRRRVFYAEWANSGGWVCAGKTLIGCKVLRHGFVSKATEARYAQYGGLSAYAGISSTGYLENKYQATPNAVSPCAADGNLSWSCAYSVTSGDVTVKISYRPVKTGWLITGSG